MGLWLNVEKKEGDDSGPRAGFTVTGEDIEIIDSVFLLGAIIKNKRSSSQK